MFWNTTNSSSFDFWGLKWRSILHLPSPTPCCIFCLIPTWTGESHPAAFFSQVTLLISNNSSSILILSIPHFSDPNTRKTNLIWHPYHPKIFENPHSELSTNPMTSDGSVPPHSKISSSPKDHLPTIIPQGWSFGSLFSHSNSSANPYPARSLPSFSNDKVSVRTLSR